MYTPKMMATVHAMGLRKKAEGGVSLSGAPIRRDRGYISGMRFYGRSNVPGIGYIYRQAICLLAVKTRDCEIKVADAFGCAQWFTRR